VDIRVHELARGRIESEVYNGCTFRVLTGFDYLNNATVIAVVVVRSNAFVDLDVLVSAQDDPPSCSFCIPLVVVVLGDTT
jgi:hypothetical protein